MSGINFCLLVGRIIEQPRIAKSGQGFVANIRLAVQDNQFTNYFNVVKFSKNEGFLRDFYVNQEIAVEGSLQSREYESEEGQKCRVTEVKAEKIEFLGSKRSQNRF